MLAEIEQQLSARRVSVPAAHNCAIAYGAVGTETHRAKAGG